MSATQDYAAGGKIGKGLKFFLRTLQIVFGIAIVGAYASDLGTAAKNHAGAHSDWIYGVVVGGICAITAAIYCVPSVKSFALFWLDLVIVILHAALIGIFGRAYLHYPKGQSYNTGDIGPDPKKMRNMVWVDVVSGLFWLCTGAGGFVQFMIVRRRSKPQSPV
jgi:hypothetical protein